MNQLRSFFLLSLPLLLNSCVKVGPNFNPPCAPVQEEWIEANHLNIQTSDRAIEKWWTVFNDPVLDNLIQIAYEQNLPLKIACYRILESRARLGFAIGEFYPQIQEGFGSASRSKLSKHQANIGPDPDIYFKDYQLGFQVAWELDFWGKFRRAIESEQAVLCSAHANYDDVLVLLLSDVASIYVQIRTTEEKINIIRNNIRIQERSLQISVAQFEGGFVSELDVQQATSLLKGTEARLPELAGELRIAQNALAVLLGIVPYDIQALLQDSGEISETSPEIAVTMPESILYHRPDVRQAYYEAAAQSARIGVAYSDFFPQISLLGQIALQSSGNVTTNPAGHSGNLLNRDSLTFNYGTSFAWPLLNYGRISNRVLIEKSRFCQLVINYQNIVLQAYQEVEDGLTTFVNSQDQVDVLSESVKAATRAVDLSTTQYVEGMVDYTRVLNTEERLLAEEERLAIAKGNIALGLIATYKALGGGWEFKYHSYDDLSCQEECNERCVEEEFVETPLRP